VFRFGLTGGIASGKSQVAALLRARGVPVIDADAVAREVVEPGRPALAAIAARWPGVVQQGRLDRKALGAVVFADPAERRALEAIVHPRIQEEVQRRMAELEAQGEPRLVYEAALLLENGLDRALDATLVVAAPPEVQAARLVARDGLTPEAAQARIAAQMPLQEKLARATFVIENHGDLPDLARRVDAVWRQVEERWPNPAGSTS
jgi:dephospho-CoA kinase